MADWKNIHLAEQGAVIAALRARVEKLRDALKFYAEEGYIEWVTKGSPDEDCYEDVDHGKLAQNALDADLAEAKAALSVKIEGVHVTHISFKDRAEAAEARVRELEAWEVGNE